jgi:hypothetical protein
MKGVARVVAGPAPPRAARPTTTGGLLALRPGCHQPHVAAPSVQRVQGPAHLVRAVGAGPRPRHPPPGKSSSLDVLGVQKGLRGFAPRTRPRCGTEWPAPVRDAVTRTRGPSSARAPTSSGSDAGRRPGRDMTPLLPGHRLSLVAAEGPSLMASSQYCSPLSQPQRRYIPPHLERTWRDTRQ